MNNRPQSIRRLLTLSTTYLVDCTYQGETKGTYLLRGSQTVQKTRLEHGRLARRGAIAAKSELV